MNIVKCGRCEKTMIAELFNTHICSPIYHGFKNIEVDYFGKFTDDNGREVTVAYGMDGITYRLVLTDKEKIPIPYLPTKPNNQEGTTEERTLPKIW